MVNCPGCDCKENTGVLNIGMLSLPVRAPEFCVQQSDASLMPVASLSSWKSPQLFLPQTSPEAQPTASSSSQSVRVLSKSNVTFVKN